MVDRVGTHKLQIERRLAASPDRVFDAWLDAERLRAFMCPGDIRHSEVELDARVGGQFRIVMHGDQGRYQHTGEFREIQRPSRLVFTWRSEATQHCTTLVTLELGADGSDGCRLLLTQELPPDPEAVQKHTLGWNSILDKLVIDLRLLPQ